MSPIGGPLSSSGLGARAQPRGPGAGSRRNARWPRVGNEWNGSRPYTVFTSPVTAHGRRIFGRPAQALLAHADLEPGAPGAAARLYLTAPDDGARPASSAPVLDEPSPARCQLANPAGAADGEPRRDAGPVEDQPCHRGVDPANVHSAARAGGPRRLDRPRGARVHRAALPALCPRDGLRRAVLPPCTGGAPGCRSSHAGRLPRLRNLSPRPVLQRPGADGRGGGAQLVPPRSIPAQSGDDRHLSERLPPGPELQLRVRREPGARGGPDRLRPRPVERGPGPHLWHRVLHGRRQRAQLRGAPQGPQSRRLRGGGQPHGNGLRR